MFDFCTNEEDWENYKNEELRKDKENDEDTI